MIRPITCVFNVQAASSLTFRGDSAPLTFDEVLSQFKRDGCSLLITGEVSPDVTAMATRRFLGAPFEDRKRILVLADTDARAARAHLPGGCHPEGDDVTIIERETISRSASTRDSTSDPPTVTVDGSLATLGEEIVAAIDAYEAEGLDPAELRLAINSLYPLLADNDYTTVVRFIREVSEAVEAVDGMSHYHLPAPEGSALVESVGTLFDARVELRRNGPDAEQRWHIPTYGQETNWVSL